MPTIADIERIKQRAETARQTAARAGGALDTVMARIKSEFGCVTLGDAKRKLAEFTADADAAETAVVDAIQKFDAKYGTDDDTD